MQSNVLPLPQLFLIRGQLLYNVVLISAIHQHESTIGIHNVPSLLNSLPHPPHPASRLTQHQVELSALYSNFPSPIHFTNGNVHTSMLLSQFTPPSPCPTMSVSLFNVSESLFLPCKWVHGYHFSRSHIYVIIYGICFFLF